MIKYIEDGYCVLGPLGRKLGGPYQSYTKAKGRETELLSQYNKKTLTNPVTYGKKYLVKAAQAALGIPDRGITALLPETSKPQKWEFVVQRHKATTDHFDLRLGDTVTNQGHSFVIRKWPIQSGEKVLAISQPTHDLEYLDFSGTIQSGYGKGEVAIIDRDQVEVINSSPDKITFYRYKGPTTEKYTILKTSGDQWLLINHTSSKELGKYFSEAPKFKMKDLPQKEYTPKPNDVIRPKIDGAYATMILRGNKTPILLSPRISKRTGLPIEYTSKLPHLLEKKVPKDFNTTILRTEIFGIKDNKEVPNRTLTGILNTNVWESREKQKLLLDKPLQIAVTDIVRYRGKDVSKESFTNKQKFIQDIISNYPEMRTPQDFSKTIDFKEGFILWRNNKPYKVKQKSEYDVYVKNIFTDKNQEMAGGFEYALKPGGPLIGRVGTGLDHATKKDMLYNPQKYIDRVAKVSAQEQFPSLSLRAPSFLGWHLDKGTT